MSKLYKLIDRYNLENAELEIAVKVLDYYRDEFY